MVDKEHQSNFFIFSAIL